ncbi:hypothetical protein QF015_001004 [Paenarthrobacter sp. TE4293]|uniref:hypothetical protein n=1 Tax=Paenarthrobacter sp. TE4293 TaxID=3381695 RepID=UPI003D217F24
MNKTPSSLQVVMFFVMAVIFATWQPFVWWRGLGAAVMLAGGVYGWWLLWRSKRKESSQEPGELE